MKNNTLSLRNSGEMMLENYKAIYEAIVSLSCDADGYGLCEDITEADIEKCKWIAAICEVLEDVPKRRVRHIFTYKNVVFDREQFLEEMDC